MIFSLFLLSTACWWFVVMYFTWRFYFHWKRGRRNYPSIVCAIGPVGWVLWSLREMKFVARLGATVPVVLGFTVSVLSFLIILNFVRQKP